MSYQEQLQNSITMYEKLKTKYNEVTSSETYTYVISTMPFDFIKAKYIIDILSLFKETNGTAKMPFRNAEEAINTFKSIIDFKHVANEVLEGASYITEVSKIIEDINTLVEKDAYLSNHLKIEELGRINKLAKECLEVVPEYKKLKTKAFRIGFIENCIENLTKEELSKLLVAGIIKGNDLDRIKLVGTPQYETNIDYLCEITGHTEIVREKFTQRLKGVTYVDELGVSRQEYLKELKAALNKNDPPQIKAESYLYTPPLGTPEPAIKIIWEEKTIGYIPKDVAQTISREYENPQLKATLKRITGGGTVDYGCEINFSISSPKIKKETAIEIEAEKE